MANTGVVFAPNGQLVCECLSSELWVQVYEKASSSSSSGTGDIVPPTDYYCVDLNQFDQNIHELVVPIIFESEMNCSAYVEQSSSSSQGIGFLTHPQAKTLSVGEASSNMFSVTTFGQVLYYKWQHSVDGGVTFYDINPNGGVFTGSDTPTLGINAGMADTTSVYNGAKFRCVISNDFETRYSDPGVLTVGG